MSAAHLHLMIVHLPVVLCPLALIFLAIDRFRGSHRPTAGYGLLLAAGALGIVAYYSGPSAYEQLEGVLAGEKDWVEQHAVAGRAAFVTLILAGVLALQAILRELQEEPVSKTLSFAIVLMALIACYCSIWAAHLGGQIRHPEIREANWTIFPSLDR